MSIREKLVPEVLARLFAKMARREKDASLTEIRLRPAARITMRVYRTATGKWETVKEA